MRIIILLIGLLSFQSDYNNPFYLEMVDLTDDGKYLAGISANGVYVVDIETEKVIVKHMFESRSRLLNIKISGDGKYLFWTRNLTMYHAEFSENEIQNIENIPSARPWLDLDINFDGSRIIATQDYMKSSSRPCSPYQRLIMEMRRNGNPFSYKMIGSTTEPCHWLHHCELLPDSSLLFIRIMQEHHLENNNLWKLFLMEKIGNIK